jgi:hypothetical protein
MAISFWALNKIIPLTFFSVQIHTTGKCILLLLIIDSVIKPSIFQTLLQRLIAGIIVKGQMVPHLFISNQY